MSYCTHFLPGSRPDGTPILSLLAKRTYSVAPAKIAAAATQLPLCTEDMYAVPDNPLYSEVAAETDLIFFKPTTDFVVIGKAYAPMGKKAFHLDCEVRAGPMKKTVRVFGDRTARIKAFGGVNISDPLPFESMELGYRRAYGGMCKDKNGTTVTFFPNPIGRGFGLKGGIDDDTESLAVPNLEDPFSPVTADNLVLGKYEDWATAPKPASFGWTRRNFYPRYTYAGVLPEYLEVAKKNREEAAAKYPELASVEIRPMDFRVYQGASDGLWGQQLKGGEAVCLTYLDRDNPTFEFSLPSERPGLWFDLGGGRTELEPILQTVVVDKEKNVLTMLWRGEMQYGGIESLAQVRKLEFGAE